MTYRYRGFQPLEDVSPADTVIGTSGNDTLNGTNFNDTINGLAGADRMLGHLGNDTYIVDNAGDVAVELAGEGTDKVNSSVNHTLAVNVENLQLTGTAGTGKGNTLNNIIQGNASANELRGMEGNDKLYGYGGPADYLYGGEGNDQLFGGIGDDLLYGGAGNDTLDGEASSGSASLLHGEGGHDLLRGNGSTSMDGGSGNDTIMGGGGSSYVQGGIGNDVLYDGGRLSGDDGNDTLYGAAGRADTLNGGAGADVLQGAGDDPDAIGGGDGDDTIYGANSFEVYGGAGSDYFVSDTTAESCRILDFETAVDKLAFSQATLRVGDGDLLVEGAVSVPGPGGFSKNAEVVLIDGTNIGSATSAYAIGDTRIFITFDGIASRVWYFESAQANAGVSDAELTHLASIYEPDRPATGDFAFIT